jgi:hypothetical protein
LWEEKNSLCCATTVCCDKLEEAEQLHSEMRNYCWR